MVNCTCPCPPPTAPCSVHFTPGPGYQMAAYLASPWFYHANHRLHPDHEGKRCAGAVLNLSPRRIVISSAVTIAESCYRAVSSARLNRLESDTVNWITRITVDDEYDLVPLMIVSDEPDRDMKQFRV